jgi:acetyl esterase/lipase
LSESILTRTPPAADVRLPYGDDPFQFGDLRLPTGAGPHPCVIAIHGGFWRARYDLTHLGHLCHALTATGFATWSLEYRRVGNPGGGWPGTFHDVAHGAAHMWTIAAEYDLDPANVLVLGHSAGGHLALWLAGLGAVSTNSPIHATPLSLRGAVSLAGVLDLCRGWDLGLSGGAVGELLGGSPESVPDRYAAASPIALLPLGVRQLLVHGTADDAVPHELSAAYNAAAIARGDDSALLSLPDTGHFEVIDPDSSVWPTIVTGLIKLRATTS